MFILEGRGVVSKKVLADQTKQNKKQKCIYSSHPIKNRSSPQLYSPIFFNLVCDFCVLSQDDQSSCHLSLAIPVIGYQDFGPLTTDYYAFEFEVFHKQYFFSPFHYFLSFCFIWLLLLYPSIIILLLDSILMSLYLLFSSCFSPLGC